MIMALLAEIYRLQQKPVQAKMQAQRAMRLMGGNSLRIYYGFGGYRRKTL